MEKGTCYRVFACIAIASTFPNTLSSNTIEFYSQKYFDYF